MPQRYPRGFMWVSRPCGSHPDRMTALLCTGVIALACSANVAQAADALGLQGQTLARFRAMRDTLWRSPGSFSPAQLDRVQITAIEADLKLADDELCAALEWSHCGYGLIREGGLRGLQADKPGAIARFERAIEAGRKAGNPTLEAHAWSEKSRVELESVNIGQAMMDAVTAVRLAESSDDAKIRAAAFSSLASAQREQGDVIAAAETSQREVDAAARSPDRIDLYFAYNNRYSIFLEIGQLCRRQRIFDDCSKALDTAEDNLGRSVKVATDLGYRALANINSAGTQIALARRMLLLKRSSQAREQALRLLQPKTAAQVLSNERIVMLNGGVTPDTLNVMKNQTRQLRHDGGRFLRVDDPNLLVAEALVRELEGDNEAATDWYIKAVEALERDRRTVTDEAGRGGFIASRVKIYESAALQLLQQKRYAEAFTMVERSRSRVLADMLATQPLRSADARANALFAESVALRNRIADNQTRLFAMGGKDESSQKDPVYLTTQKQVREDEAAYQNVLSRARTEAPQVASLTTAATSDFTTLQQAMRDEGFETLQFLRSSSGLVVWHSSAEGSHARSVLVTDRTLFDSIAAMSSSLTDPSLPFDEASARALFLWMVNPVLPHMHSKRLVILPGDAFTNLPFQVLINPADGRSLGEQFQISYAPSGTLLLGLRRSLPLGRARVVALADPGLPGATEEIASIRKIFDGNGRFDAMRVPREADMKGWVVDAQVVHLAVHGTFSKSNPMLSALQMAPGGGDDGLLTANEMFGLQMRGKPLVVLSACETGLGASTASGEVLGMSRALLFAGANALVLARWRVESESSARWMDTFYSAAVTKAPDEAAQIASNRLRADPATRHPYYWAPFYVVAR